MELLEYTDVPNEPRNVSEVHSGLNWRLVSIYLEELIEKELEYYRGFDLRLKYVNVMDLLKKFRKFDDMVVDKLLYEFSKNVYDIVNEVLDFCYLKVLKRYKKISNFYMFPEYMEAEGFLDRYVDLTVEDIYFNIISKSLGYFV
jgi:hypothetical protein